MNCFKKSVSIFLVVALIILAVPIIVFCAVDGALAVDVFSRVSVSPENLETWLSFTPLESGEYAAYSTGEYDVQGYLYQSREDKEYLAYNDDGGENRNFRLTHYLQAGVTYYYKVSCYNPEESAEFDVGIKKVLPDSDLELVLNSPYLVTIENWNSMRFTFKPEETGCYKIFSTSDGFQGNLNLTVFGETMSDVQYAPSRSDGNFELFCFLKAGVVYNLSANFYSEEYTAPGEYIFCVQKADKPIKPDETADSEITDFKHGNLIYPYSMVYSFLPEETGKYIFRGDTNGEFAASDVLISVILCDTSGNEIFSDESYGDIEIHSSLQKDKRYYYWMEFSNQSETDIESLKFDCSISKESELELLNLTLNQTLSVSFNPDKVSEILAFTPEQDGRYTIFSSGDYDSMVYFYENLEDINHADYDDDSGENLNFKLMTSLKAGKTYYFKVGLWNNLSNEEFNVVIIKEPPLRITLQASSGGSVTGAGEYEEGDLAMITAVPDSGYMFDGWYENDKKIDGATVNYVLTVNSNRTIEAKFVPYQFEVTDIVIEGIDDNKDKPLTFTANVIGGSGTVKHTFYILRNGKVYYSNQNSSIPVFSYEAISSGTYTAIVYSIDETGNKVSYTKQFTIV